MAEIEKPVDDFEILRISTLVLALIICVGIAISIIVRASNSAPPMRPLLNNLSVADAPKVIDVLDENEIWYRMDLPHHMLYVAKEQSEQARTALATVGMVVEYPKYHGKVIIKPTVVDYSKMPIYLQPWFYSATRLLAGFLVIFTLTFAVLRPALKALIETLKTPK
ncbi:MAG: hypothetical protein MJK04_00570 [Psychrosphaera sp.]|nr:hypothetical protein [Psychrosphaera sp.]